MFRGSLWTTERDELRHAVESIADGKNVSPASLVALARLLLDVEERLTERDKMDEAAEIDSGW